MTKKQTDKLMNFLLGTAAFAILLGAIFKLQHYPSGNKILYIGFMASFILSGIEVSRLKKIIKVLEKHSEKTQ
jgi:hypothetical protein